MVNIGGLLSPVKEYYALAEIQTLQREMGDLA